MVSISAELILLDERAKIVPWIGFLPFKMMWRGFEDNYPEESKKYELEYKQGYPGFYLKTAARSIRILKQVKKILPNVKSPVLVVQARKDELAHLDSGDIILSGISSECKELFWLEDSMHISILGPEREMLFDKIIDFIQCITAKDSAFLYTLLLF